MGNEVSQVATNIGSSNSSNSNTDSYAQYFTTNKDNNKCTCKLKDKINFVTKIRIASISLHPNLTKTTQEQQTVNIATSFLTEAINGKASRAEHDYVQVQSIYIYHQL